MLTKSDVSDADLSRHSLQTHRLPRDKSLSGQSMYHSAHIAHDALQVRFFFFFILVSGEGVGGSAEKSEDGASDDAENAGEGGRGTARLLFRLTGDGEEEEGLSPRLRLSLLVPLLARGMAAVQRRQANTDDR